MRTRRFSSMALLALVTTALPLGTASRAQESVDINRDRIAAERLKLRSQTIGETNLRTGGPLAERSQSVKVLIELEGEPTTRVYAAARAGGASAQATTEAQRQLGLINQAQQRILSSLQSSTINAKVIYRTQRVYNGIAVRVNANQLVNIRRLPGVKAIHQLNTKQLDNASSVPLIGAPELWNGGGLNKTGEGIKIGIIDTGIDYIHTNHGGTGLEADYDRNDVTVISDNVIFPSAKVAGGYDFVGDDYDASDPARETPAPDPDPQDCNGHGSHVAGTAAGFGVNADGSTYTGTYGPSTPFNSLRIGPGVAPKATLYALKVFGCDGSTDVTDLAIEWAVDPNGDGDFSDRLDVINMSLGSDYGSAYDSSTIASDNAVEAGVIVVASAGNSSDTYYISGSPGVSARTINVASSVDSTSIFDGFRVNTPASIAGVKPAAQSVAFNWEGKSPVTANLVYPSSQPTGCVAFNDSNKALINGKIVLLDWTEGQCGSVARGNNVVAAGGVGFILADNSDDFDLLITGSAVIPAVSTPKSVGEELKSALGSSTVNVTLTPEYNNSIKLVDNNLNDTLSAFSSRGPRRGDSLLKPDIAAPGQSIFSTAVGTGDEGTSLNGTSMAAPHVAGSMALLRQMHPDWTVEELKALAMNTANKDIRSARAANSPIYGPGRVGAGRITLPDAAGSKVVAYNANEPGVVSVSFGAPEVVGETTAVKNIRVVNKSNSPVSYNVAYRPVVDTPGVSYSLSKSTVELEPNGFANIVVTMRATAAQMKHLRDVTVSPVQTLPRHWMNEEAGYVTLTPTTGSTAINNNPNLRIPIYAAPRPASEMRAKTGQLDFGSGDTGSDEIELVGQDVNTGTNYPTDTLSIVTAFELQHSSPNDQESADIVNNADLKYVGVSSDVNATQGTGAPNGDVTKATLSFGVATYGNWSTPNESEFDIYIDTNRDGEDDYVLFNWNLGLASGGGDATDVVISVLLNLNSGQLILADYVNVSPAVLNTAIFNSNVMVLPVAASDLGLTANNSTFNYRIFTFSRDADGVVDDSGTLTYNAAQPGLDLSGNFASVPAYADLDGEVIPVDYNKTAYKTARSQGVLLLHHHNATGKRTEVVRLKGDLTLKVYMPMIAERGYRAALSGANEVPPVPTSATGAAFFSYNAATRVLTYNLTVANISGVTAAHIHRGAAGTNGPVAYNLLPSGATLSPSSPLSGSVTLSPDDIGLLNSQGLYVNVHTAARPGGEIRGQIVRTP
jgi:subtilisin family serine protease